MIQFLRQRWVRLAATLALVIMPLATPAMAFAATAIQDCLSNGTGLTNLATSGTNCVPADTAGSTTQVNNLITTGINIFSAIVGLISVIMIIYGGFRYITSGGDSGKITSAKNTIVYAIIGLVVVAFAQFIVQFVLNKVTTVGS